MKQLSLRGAICLALCVLVASPVLAQGQGRGRGRGGFGGGFGFGGATFLVGIEQVQKELKISDEQKEKINPILEEARASFGGFGRGGGGGGQQLSDEERQKRQEERAKASEERNKKIEGILTAEQNARLKQIQLQQQGVAALSSEEVAKELKLSDDQVGALKIIQEEAAKKVAELRPQGRRGGGGGGFDQEAFRANQEKMQQLRKDVENESLAVLSSEQRTQFEKMKGEKFEIDYSQLGGGRGGGRGRRGGNNNNST